MAQQAIAGSDLQRALNEEVDPVMREEINLRVTALRLFKLKTVPIIVISGYDPQQCSQLALDAGCNDYLCKPIDFEQLEKILVASVPLNKSR